MSLLITITNSPDSVVIAESSKAFDNNGGSIGRGKDNNWVLEDPERFLSSCHCRFSYENNQFHIIDLSTNGTFYNDSPHPIGKNLKLPVNDGDTFALGDYVFSIAVSNAASLADPFSGSVESLSPAVADDIFAQSDSNSFSPEGGTSSPFAGAHVSTSELLFSRSTEETDPLAALDKVQTGGGSMNPAVVASGGFGHNDSGFDSNVDPFTSTTHSDQSGLLNQQVSWPDAVLEQPAMNGGIPDDWDDELIPTPEQPAPAQLMPSPHVPMPPIALEPAQVMPSEIVSKAPSLPELEQTDVAESETLVAEHRALQKANTILHAELEALKQQIKQQQRGASGDITVDTSIVDAMGFQKYNLTDDQITQINKLTGEVFREMVSGLMQVLGSRSSIKNEFRMNVTTIQPVENNPLKFSANVDDALENMFIKDGNAYKKPLNAVREGFDGVAEHQVAILAGIRSAFKGIVERFDPAFLDARFSKLNKGGLIPGSQKAKNWDSYIEYYNELAGDADNTFQYLFGDDFVRAYEDQLQRLAIARNSKKTKDTK